MISLRSAPPGAPSDDPARCGSPSRSILRLRAHSGAFGRAGRPFVLPVHVQPLAVARNVLEYLDRGATFAVAIAVAMLISIGTARVALTAAEKALLRFGAAWFVCFYAMTVFLPVRSSLYALTPSVGAAVALAAVASAVQRMSQKRFEICCGALMAVIFLSVPIYRQRNERWVVPADLSTHVVRTLRVATAGYSGGQVVVVDDASARFGLDSSFGASFGNAVHLMVGSNWEGADCAGDEPCSDESTQWCDAPGLRTSERTIGPGGSVIRDAAV